MRTHAAESVTPASGAEPPRVSIVIPVFNKFELTRACLAALARHTPQGWAEVLVVDNGSSDGTAEYLASLRPPVRVLKNPENLGFARACNLGAGAARAPYLLFLNNDTEVRVGWLESLVRLLDVDPGVAAAGSRLLFPDGTLQHAGVMLVDDQKLPDPLVARHVHYGAAADLPDANRPRAYQALTAACLLVRRSAFEQADGFDEGYWNGYEDVDLCLKLQQHGHALVYEPASVVTHHESKSGTERFTGVARNIERLHERWCGRVEPDAVVDPQGRFVWTEAARIRDYAPPSTADVPLAPTTGIVSIVILTLNQLDVTQQCVASLQRHTPEPHEVVFVDNGSTDGTVEWLRAEVARHPAYRLVENTNNEGFARGCNQGIAATSGEFVLLLNNDVVLTPHWLKGLLECIERTPQAGIVGPMTNQISGRQRVERPAYEHLEQLSAFAESWRERHRHQRTFAPRVVGFCMLFKRELVREIGRLDESFGTGNFEDDDLCLRAELAGHRNLIAGDVFIHHHGSRSFVGNGIDPRAAMSRNRARFTAKWRPPAAQGGTTPRVLLLDALERAHDLDATGRFRDAVELCLEAIRLAPAEATPYLTLAGLLVRGGDWNDALDVLQNLPSGFTDARARLLAAHALQGVGHFGAACRMADSVERDMDVRARALNRRGLLAHQAGDIETATACFNAALSADRGYGEPYANLGALLWGRDPGEQAFELFERGVVLSPESPDALEFYCTAAKALGETVRAAAVVRELRGLHPIHRGLTFALIDLLLTQPENAAAMLEIENALEWFPLEDGLLRAALAVRAKVGARAWLGETHAGGRLSLCMIVKNEATTLVRCLRSVMPLVDEMIVVDTGSTDATADIATALGAKVTTIEWSDDFAAARNAALAAATGEWVLVLDADEALAASDLPRLRAIVRGEAGSEAAGYSMTTRNYTTTATLAGWRPNDGAYVHDEAGTGWYPSRKVRLFHNDPRIRFEGALHEVVEPSLGRYGLVTRSLDVPVHHYGPLSAEREHDKAGRYYALAKQKLAHAPHDPAALFELAVQAGVVANHDEAIELWTRYVKLPGAERLALAWMNLGHSYLETNQFELSARASREALTVDKGCKEALYNLALCELCRGRYGETLARTARLSELAPGHLPALGLRAAACVLAKDAARLETTSRRLAQLGERPAAYLQALAARLKQAGRGGDARRLADAARQSWKESFAAEGLAASDEDIEAMIARATGMGGERSAA